MFALGLTAPLSLKVTVSPWLNTEESVVAALDQVIEVLISHKLAALSPIQNRLFVLPLRTIKSTSPAVASVRKAIWPGCANPTTSRAPALPTTVLTCISRYVPLVRTVLGTN